MSQNGIVDDLSCRHVVAIDGPAAAGKTTVARAVAQRLGIPFVDTGVIYRTVTYEALRRGVEPSDAAALSRVIDSLEFTLGPAGELVVNGQTVGPEIRSPEVDAAVSEVSAHPLVRERLLPVQRQIASQGAAVIVGRDITTVVIPDAGLRVFLSASTEERAKRRHRELIARGIDVEVNDVLQDIEERDRLDSTRPVAPLRLDENAVMIDTDGRSIEEVVSMVEELARPVVATEGR